MTKKLNEIIDRMTPGEQTEVETFALFLLARRKLRKYKLQSDDISIQELVRLVEASGSFDWLAAGEENAYSITDGESVEWPVKSFSEDIQ